MPTVGNNLATFLGNRLSMSFTNLGCDAFGLTDPVNVTTAGDGDRPRRSNYNTAQQQATLPAPQVAAPGQPTRARATATTGTGTAATGTTADRARPPGPGAQRPPGSGTATTTGSTPAW